MTPDDMIPLRDIKANDMICIDALWCRVVKTCSISGLCLVIDMPGSSVPFHRAMRESYPRSSVRFTESNGKPDDRKEVTE